MDSWLKAKAAEVAKAAAEAAENASKIGNEIGEYDLGAWLDKAVTLPGTKDLEFEEGSLGLQLEGPFVQSIVEAGQAAQLGVVPGDQLIAVAGMVVPSVAVGDEEDEKKTLRLIKKWIKESPRPVRLTFRAARAQEPAPAAVHHVVGDHGDSFEEALGIADEPLDAEEAFSYQVGGTEINGNMQSHLESSTRADTSGFSQEPAEGEDGGLVADAFFGHASAEEQFGGGGGSLPGELQTLRQELQKLQAHNARLSTESAQARQAKLQMSADLDIERRASAAAQKKVAELKAELATVSEQCQEFHLAVASSEAEDRIFREDQEARARVLEDEVNRLRAELSRSEERNREAVEKASAKQDEFDGAIAKQIDESRMLVARAVEAEGRMETAEWDLRKLQETSATELSKLVEEHGREVGGLKQQLVECERRAAEEITELKKQLADHQASSSSQPKSQSERSGNANKSTDEDDEGDEELGERIPADAVTSACSKDDRPEVSVLRGRIDMLEARCGALQRKLSSRPIVFQKPTSGSDGVQSRTGAGGLAVQWEPWLRNNAGPRVAVVVLRLYSLPDRMLRNFTEKLLQHDAWLWLFYAHLVVLYTIVASYHAQTTASAGPVDIINKHVKQAPAASIGAQ